MTIAELEAKRRAAERQIDQLAAPQRALEAAEQELSALDQQIEQARQQAARDATMARLAALAGAGAQALADVQAAQQAFDAVVLPALERYSAARAHQADVRGAFYDVLAELAPEARRKYADHIHADQVLAELEQSGADLAGVLASLDGREKPLDRPADMAHQFPGSLRQALREQAVRQLGHALPPDTVPQIDHRTAQQMLRGN